MSHTIMKPSVYPKEVVFKNYIHDDNETMTEMYLRYIWTSSIVGLEREDGKVDVFKDGVKLNRPLRNKEIFAEKYFTEAI
jgi:hypothetical protein